MNWTKERLEALSPHDRAQLYANALNVGTPEGNALAELISEAGLPYSEEGSVSANDPLVLAMEAIIDTPEGKAACVKATEDGWPAIAGIDPMLVKTLKGDYSKKNMTTNWAGKIVADLMRRSGYRVVGKKKSTPNGCIAQSGELWEKKKKNFP